MKFRKALSIFMAVSMLTGMVSVNVMAAETEEKEEAAEETTLTMWSWTPITRTCEKMLEAFEEENPGINIEFSYYNYDPEYLSALSGAAASENLPYIIGLQPGSLTAQYADYLIDYTE